MLTCIFIFVYSHLLSGEEKLSRILIIGSGIVGQATGKGLTAKKHNVVFIDTNPPTVNALKREGFDARLSPNFGDAGFDIVMFCLPTPSKRGGEVNLSYLTKAVEAYAGWLRGKDVRWHLIVIRGTILPGTTRNTVLPPLEKISGKRAGKDFGICVQPEFLRANSHLDDFMFAWAIVIGELDKRSGDVLEKIYRGASGELYRCSIESAEFVKYIHNVLNATKISFANTAWLLANQLGIDGNAVLEIVTKTAEGFWNPRYGMTEGRPFGGSCLPKDMKGLIRYGLEKGGDMTLFKAVL